MPDRLRLPRARRLTRASEFAYVREHGHAFRGELMTLALAQGEADKPPRVGVITSKRVGNAVIRNRLRRQFRELFRKHQPRIRRGILLVTIARPAAARTSFAALEREWLRLAERAAILHP